MFKQNRNSPWKDQAYWYKLHFIKLETSKATMKIKKIHTDDSVADMLTKAIPSAKFKLCLDLAGICERWIAGKWRKKRQV